MQNPQYMILLTSGIAARPSTILLAFSAHRHQYTADTNLKHGILSDDRNSVATGHRLGSTARSKALAYVVGKVNSHPFSVHQPQSIKSIKSILGCSGSLGYPEESRKDAPCCQGHGSQISSSCQITKSGWETGPEVDISSLGRNARNGLGK